MKPETMFLVLLLKLKSFERASLATATVKVCLKYEVEHRVPARKQRRALEALLWLTFELCWLSHILWTLWPSRVPEAYSSSELSKSPLSLRMPELCEMKNSMWEIQILLLSGELQWLKNQSMYHLWYSWHAHNFRKNYDSGHLRITVPACRTGRFQGILRCHPASCLLTDSIDSATWANCFVVHHWRSWTVRMSILTVSRASKASESKAIRFSQAYSELAATILCKILSDSVRSISPIEYLCALESVLVKRKTRSTNS